MAIPTCVIKYRTSSIGPFTAYSSRYAPEEGQGKNFSALSLQNLQDAITYSVTQYVYDEELQQLVPVYSDFVYELEQNQNDDTIEIQNPPEGWSFYYY